MTVSLAKKPVVSSRNGETETFVEAAPCRHLGIALLMVAQPTLSAGHSVQCPDCKGMFRIPFPKSMLDCPKGVK